MDGNQSSPQPQEPAADGRGAEIWEPPSFEVISGADILSGGDLNPDALGLGNS